MIKFHTILLAFFLASLALAWAGKPLVYDLVAADGEKTMGLRFINEALKVSLADNFQVVEIKNTASYISPKILAGGIVNQAQTESGEVLIGNVTIGYVVGQDGKAYGAVVLMSTDPRLNPAALAATERWRFQPAVINGATVATAAVQNFFFKDNVHPSGFAMSRLVLYQDDATLKARMSKAEDLADYVKQLDDQAQRYWASNSVPESLQVVVGIRPGNKSRVWFISSLQADDGHLESLREILESVPAPSVVGGPVVVNIVAKIAGGDGRDPLTGSVPEKPLEWHDAVHKMNTPNPGIDAILDAVWPDTPST